MTSQTTPMSDALNNQNIVLKDIRFANNKDFLNQLDEEIKQTELSVKQMNDRFDQLQIRS
jgi:hypothetical protein